MKVGRYLVHLTYHIVSFLHESQAETVKKSQRQPKGREVVKFIEIKRITVNHESGQYAKNVQQPFEFHGIGFSRNRTERPLKNEQGRPLYHTYKH